MHCQDGERQKEKQGSKIVESELKMANEELIKVERKDIERTQKKVWNTSYFLLASLHLWSRFSIPDIYLSFGQQEPNAKSI